jgi:hypothetical protein
LTESDSKRLGLPGYFLSDMALAFAFAELAI